MGKYKTLYETNKDFKEYVDRFAKSKKKSVDIVLEWLITHEVGDFYIKEENKGV